MLGKKCQVCKNTDISVLEIHHKKYNRKERGASLNEIKLNKKNFILLCANCHRKKHLKVDYQHLIKKLL